MLHACSATHQAATPGSCKQSLAGCRCRITNKLHSGNRSQSELCTPGPDDLLTQLVHHSKCTWYKNRHSLQPVCSCRIKGRGAHRGDRSQSTPERDRVLMELNRQKMLPAIWFIFSRQGCDRAAKEVELGTLVSPESELQIVDSLSALQCAPAAGSAG